MGSNTMKLTRATRHVTTRIDTTGGTQWHPSSALFIIFSYRSATNFTS